MNCLGQLRQFTRGSHTGMDSGRNYLIRLRCSVRTGWPSACVGTEVQEYCFQALPSQPGTNCLSLGLRPDRASRRVAWREIAPFAQPIAPSWPVAFFCVFLCPLLLLFVYLIPLYNNRFLLTEYYIWQSMVVTKVSLVLTFALFVTSQ